MKIIVTGATGLVGAEVLRQAILDPDIEQVIALSRKVPYVQHAKIKHLVHTDFLDYSGLEQVFRECDACAWCLGISQSQVSKAKYEEITYGYALAAAKAIQQANPSMAFIFVSGAGADSTEQSRTLFARIKGKAENALKKLGMSTLYIARPGGIKPVHQNPNAPFIYKLFTPVFPVLEWLMPSKVISSVQLGKALLHLIKHGHEQQTLENPALQALAGQ